MFESISVVFVVTIFIVIGIVIYASFQGYSSTAANSAITELRSSRVQHSALTMPEFSCEACGGSVRENCFDMTKLDAFNSLPIATKDKYYSYFGASSLVVEQVYPDRKSWRLYNKTKQGAIRTYIPVLLCNATQNNYYFGVLTIDVSPQ